MLHRGSEAKKRQNTNHRCGVTRRAANRSQHSRSLHDNMMKVMDVTDAKEGRLTELHIRNAGNVTRNGDDFNEMVKRLCCSFHARKEAKNCICNPDKIWIQGVKANGYSLRPEDGCGQVCCRRPSDTPERFDIIKTQQLQSARDIMQMGIIGCRS